MGRRGGDDCRAPPGRHTRTRCLRDSQGPELEIYRATRGGFVVDLSVAGGNSAAYFSKSPVISPAVPIGRLLGWVDACAKRRAKIKSKGAYASFPDPVPV